MSKAKLQNAGYSPRQADAINGFVSGTLTAAGITLATAAVCPNDINIFATVAAGTGCALGYVSVNSGLDELNVGDEITVINRGANALLVYAPTGATIDGAASVSVATASSARFKKVTTTDYTVV